MTQHVLENDLLRAEIVPELGAGLANLRVNLGGVWAPLLRPTSPETVAAGKPSGLASFTLAPFSNRIPGARFAFEGREYALRPTTPDGTQHGDVRGRPHATVEVTATRAEYLFDSRGVPDFNFPFPLTLRTTYVLDADALALTLALTNVGDGPMPAGLGLHPYFVRDLGGATDVRLAFRALGVYVTDASQVPDGPASPLPADLDFAEGRAVDGAALNTVFGAWDGRTTLEYLGTPHRAGIEADAVFSHLVVFTAPDGTLALEPVTHATDAFNLHARGVPGVGFVRLAPGETLAGTVRFRFAST